MSEPTPEEEVPPVEPQTVLPDPVEAIRALGFDPERVLSVVLTPTTVVAVAADYPEPYTPPQEEL